MRLNTVALYTAFSHFENLISSNVTLLFKLDQPIVQFNLIDKTPRLP